MLEPVQLSAEITKKTASMVANLVPTITKIENTVIRMIVVWN
jgi:hypothetical protein